MNNFEMDAEAKVLADKYSSYTLARMLLENSCGGPTCKRYQQSLWLALTHVGGKSCIQL